jgi:hypothetical protein
MLCTEPEWWKASELKIEYTRWLQFLLFPKPNISSNFSQASSFNYYVDQLIKIFHIYHFTIF